MNQLFDECTEGLSRLKGLGLKGFGAGLASFTLTLICSSAPAQQFSAWSAPLNLGHSINTGFSEFHAAISADGLSLYFASDRPGGFGENDLWVAQRPNRNADWDPAQNLGPNFNTAHGEFGPALSPDGHWLFFATAGLAGGNTSDIYAAFRNDANNDFGWGQPVNLGTGVNSSHNGGGPTLFVDPETGGITLYFTRLNKPGQGDWDIYQSTLLTNGTFGDAILVSELSSPYEDTHPTVRRDGLEIIFSSTRPGSFGGNDLWVSTRATTRDRWSTPVNLGPAVNSAYFDGAPYLSDDGQTLILTSDRPGGFGGNDFYISTRKKLP
jgi:hypothetical protein